MSNIQGRSEKELVLVFVFCDMRTIEDKVAEVSLKSEETLKVSLKSGDTLYFISYSHLLLTAGLGPQDLQRCSARGSVLVFHVNILATLCSGDYQDLPEAVGLHQQQPRPPQHLKPYHPSHM